MQAPSLQRQQQTEAHISFYGWFTGMLWDEKTAEMLPSKDPLECALRGGETVPYPQSWQNTGSATTVVSKTELDSLETVYALRNRDAVRAFIELHPRLMPVLQHAPREIHKCFPDARFSLELSVDPEEPDFVELVVWIATRYDPAAAVERLLQLNRDWWLSAMRQVENKLAINVEPQ